MPNDPIAPQFSLFLPQMRLSLDTLAERARAAEAAGFYGMALMDHLAPPLAESQPMYEAMATAMWLVAHTERLTIGHLVLCDAFRHPAVLAREAVALDHASGGRFELGIGWGSVPAEFEVFGVGDTAAHVRVGRLGETLEVVRALWSGEPVTFQGEHFQLAAAQQQPTPLGPIPILIGGSGPKTLELVRRHADWCNLPIHQLDRLDDVRETVGADVRISTQHRVVWVPPGGDRAEIEATAHRRFGTTGMVVGESAELVEHFGGLNEIGVERFYVWFADFAPPETLAGFGDGVIAAFR
jgi:alkanesulfonate monooxygenase SsuD/methylene tetrahydromethanopterin reductase-like flavin-dependent oxidoreductase (luciferase family)